MPYTRPIRRFYLTPPSVPLFVASIILAVLAVLAVYGKMSIFNASYAFPHSARRVSHFARGRSVSRRIGRSQRQIVVLPRRHLHPLLPQRGKRADDARARGMRHDHVVDIAALGCDERR